MSAGSMNVFHVMESDARAARADRLTQAGMSSHSVEESRRAMALWSRSIEAIEYVRELSAASEPFARFNGSEQFIDIRVPTSAVTRLRAALTRCGVTP